MMPIITPPEATNTGPGFNRGSGGGARGCGFEEQIEAYARTEGGHFLSPTTSVCMCVCVSVATNVLKRKLVYPLNYKRRSRATINEFTNVLSLYYSVQKVVHEHAAVPVHSPHAPPQHTLRE